jgi:hypothetical protein
LSTLPPFFAQFLHCPGQFVGEFSRQQTRIPSAKRDAIPR